MRSLDLCDKTFRTSAISGVLQCLCLLFRVFNHFYTSAIVP
jgi:hypothetical protein